MDYKQKLGYMVLGTVITLMVMAVSRFFPPLHAQRHSEYIVCKGISIVDDNGKKAIHLTAGKNRNHIIVYDKEGKRAVGLQTSGEGNGVVVFDKAGDIKWETP